MNFISVSYEQAKKMVEEQSVTIADVRSQASYEEAHIPNAQHLTIANLDAFCAASDKTKPVLVYCYHGISSQAVAQHLIAQGFKEVYNLVGGFEAWQVHQAAK